MTGWGFYRVYDAVRSNRIAEAAYFAVHRKLVIMTLGDSAETVFVEFEYPGLVEEDPTTTAEAISRLLKARFNTEYVTFHEFGSGVWV